MVLSQRMVGRKYNIYEKNSPWGSRFIWGRDGWIDDENPQPECDDPSYCSDDYLSNIGYDLNRVELLPLTLDKQLEELLHINPTKIEFRIDTIIVDYGEGKRLIHVCRSLRDGIQRLSDELYFKRIQAQ